MIDVFPGTTKLILLFSRLGRLARHPSLEEIEKIGELFRNLDMACRIEADSGAIRIWASDRENPEILITVRDGEWEAERS